MKKPAMALAAVFAAILAMLMLVAGGDDQQLAAGQGGLREGTVPADLVPLILGAAQTCPEATAPLLAAQIDAESGWDRNAVSSAGAQGLAQFMPGTWALYGVDADGNGVTSPFEPADAIYAQARYMCDLVGLVRRLGGDTVSYALAAYNAGPGTVLACQCVPHNGQTEIYVAKILELIAKYTAELDTGVWVKPVAVPYQVGAVFGQRGELWSSGYHTGYDYVVPVGTQILAASTGRVTQAAWAGPYGWHIVIDHGSQVESTYSHLSALGVHAGDAVQTSQVIALSGDTGNTTGPHLHFEVKVNGQFVDPVTWLSQHAEVTPGTGDLGTAAAVIAAARSQLGVPYVFGGGSLTGPTPAAPGGPAGFDCSSLTRYAWYVGTRGQVTLPRTADAQHHATRPVTSPAAGDLVFFQTGRVAGSWDHVGIYLGAGQFIHAPRTGKTVEITTLTSSYYAKIPRSYGSVR